MIYWIIFLILDGIADGFLYNVKDPERKNKPNEHIALWLRRALVALALFGNPIDNWLVYTTAFLVSFYLHDTPYYLTRHLLNKSVYPNWYWVTSKTSTAWSDKYINATARIIMLQIGLFIYSVETAWIASALMLVAFGIGVRNRIKLKERI